MISAPQITTAMLGAADAKDNDHHRTRSKPKPGSKPNLPPGAGRNNSSCDYSYKHTVERHYYTPERRFEQSLDVYRPTTPRGGSGGGGSGVDSAALPVVVLVMGSGWLGHRPYFYRVTNWWNSAAPKQICGSLGYPCVSIRHSGGYLFGERRGDPRGVSNWPWLLPWAIAAAVLVAEAAFPGSVWNGLLPRVLVLSLLSLAGASEEWTATVDVSEASVDPLALAVMALPVMVAILRWEGAGAAQIDDMVRDTPHNIGISTNSCMVNRPRLSPSSGPRGNFPPPPRTIKSSMNHHPTGRPPAPPNPKKRSPPSSAAATPTTPIVSTASSVKNAAMKTTGVMDYLRQSVSRDSLLGLYADEKRGRYVCRAVLQRLPETSQQIIVRMSCTGGHFSIVMIRDWLKGFNSSAISSAASAQMNKLLAKQLNELYHWAIVTEKQKPAAASTSTSTSTSTSGGMLTLTTEFFKGLKDSLQSLDASPWNALTEEERRFLVQEANKDETSGRPVRFPAMTPEDLERYTQSQWDAVLHYLVGTPNMKVQPNPAVAHFLLQTNLMQPDPDYKRSRDDAPLVITQKGYDFMLQDNSQQVWHFVVQYLATVAESKRGEYFREALLVLICLSFSRFGECYSTVSLTKLGVKIVKDLSLFGIIYYKKIGKGSVFYPTRIAMQLAGGNLGGGGIEGKGGGMWSWSNKALESALAQPIARDSSHLAIIVQTNFQLCAYTTSELHVSMLGLFCDLHTIRRLPNVIFMVITRDSIKGAFNLGIQAQQILRFLEKHAHPKLRQGSGGLGASVSTSPLPGNVVDQICLWDRERHRVLWNDVFVHQAIMEGEFRAVHKYVVKHGAHTWSSESSNKIYVKYDQVEHVQKFIQEWRARAAAAGR
eukprot:jgi/Psemu1/328278/estExt_fgenesh1_pg.C_11560001